MCGRGEEGIWLTAPIKMIIRKGKERGNAEAETKRWRQIAEKNGKVLGNLVYDK